MQVIFSWVFDVFICRSFLEPFILPKDLFLADLYLLEKNEYSLVKGRSENLVPTCLRTFWSGYFPSYDCFGGLWLPRRASVYPKWCFLWVCWWHSEKPSSYGRNQLTSWMGEFLSILPPQEISVELFSWLYEPSIQVYIYNLELFSSYPLTVCNLLELWSVGWDFGSPMLHLVARKLVSSVWAWSFWVTFLLL